MGFRDIMAKKMVEGVESNKKQAFIQPWAQLGWPESIVQELIEKIPEEWSWDHREIYFDFRLNRWMKHIEPPDLEQVLKEYLSSVDNLPEALDHIQESLQQVLRGLRKGNQSF